jgi:hypothetical protein
VAAKNVSIVILINADNQYYRILCEMKSILLLNYNSDIHQIEEEEKSAFIRSLLEKCFENTPVIDQIRAIYETDEPLSVSKKMQLRNILTTYNIMITDEYRDDELRIYLDNEKIGGFKKPTYKIVQDLQATDPKSKIYIEMRLDFWSSFDEDDGSLTNNME